MQKSAPLETPGEVDPALRAPPLLYLAAQSGDGAVYFALLRNGAPYMEDPNGRTPLDIAECYG
jgi:hypothetical protein